MYFQIRPFLQSAARISLTVTVLKGKQRYEHVDKPIKLISLSEDGNLQLDQDAKQKLSRIPGNVTVITCLGKYRSGKSTLMNKLYGVTNGGFQVGYTTKAETKGVWVMTKPHPDKPGDTLVLLDTEGLYDAHSVNKHKDRKLFAIAVLCSSSIVNNIQNIPDARDIEDLVSVLYLAKDWMLDRDVQKSVVFPYLHFMICNFKLRLERESPREYLDDLLSSQQASIVTTMFEKRSLHTLCPLNEEKCFKAQFTDFENVVIENAQEFRIGDAVCGMNEWLIHVEELIKCQDTVPQIATTEKLIKASINKREYDHAMDTFDEYMSTLKFPNTSLHADMQKKFEKIIERCKRRAYDGCADAEEDLKKKINEVIEEDQMIYAAAIAAFASATTAGIGLPIAIGFPILAVPGAIVGLVSGGAAAWGLLKQSRKSTWLKRKSSGKKE